MKWFAAAFFTASEDIFDWKLHVFENSFFLINRFMIGR